jgi:hypothetical protein
MEASWSILSNVAIVREGAFYSPERERARSRGPG